MPKLTKVADYMRGVADNAIDSAPKKRLAAVRAAAVSSNKRTSEAYKIAVAGLEKLGLEIDAICASGDASALDEKMKALRWSSNQRIGLKQALSICGANPRRVVKGAVGRRPVLWQ
jgi:hypothetical protein